MKKFCAGSCAIFFILCLIRIRIRVFDLQISAFENKTKFLMRVINVHFSANFVTKIFSTMKFFLLPENHLRREFLIDREFTFRHFLNKKPTSRLAGFNLKMILELSSFCDFNLSVFFLR